MTSKFKYLQNEPYKKITRKASGMLPYSGKVWRANCLVVNLLFSGVWEKKVW